MSRKTVTLLTAGTAVTTLCVLALLKMIRLSQYRVKGKDFTGIYYTPDDMFYDNIVPDILFKDEEEAREYGYRPSNVSRGKK